MDLALDDDEALSSDGGGGGAKDAAAADDADAAAAAIAASPAKAVGRGGHQLLAGEAAFCVTLNEMSNCWRAMSASRSSRLSAIPPANR